MPPPVEELSDEESGDIPFTTAPEDKNDANNNAEEVNEEDDDSEEEEGVYIVEEIKNHDYQGNTLMLLVKWKGYEALKDHTWEPEKALQDGAEDVLNTYFKKIGGRPEKPEKPKAGAKPGKKRKSMAEKKETTATTPAETKRRRQSAPKADAKNSKADDNASSESDEEEPSDWVPEGKNWEAQVKSVDTIIRDAKDGALYALLHWTNGKRSRIHVSSCYENCPLKMLKFYEKHLVFRDG